MQFALLISALPARILRLLATHHIFKETAPDVFTHNRLSTVLDTGKSVEEVLAEYGLFDGCSPYIELTWSLQSHWETRWQLWGARFD